MPALGFVEQKGLILASGLGGRAGILDSWAGGGHGESTDGTDALPGLPWNRQERQRNALSNVRGDGTGGRVSRADRAGIGARTIKTFCPG
jgi:hypothetical protein